MIIDIKQLNKEIYGSNFKIISNNNILGSINVKGKLGSMESSLNGNFNNIPFELKYTGGLFTKTKNKKFRLYQIIVSEKNVGEIYQTDKKTGLFSKYSYNELIYNDKSYKEYGIGLGTETKCPIYMNDIQVAQIDTESIIYNDLHNYKIYVKNNNYSLVSIIIACYMYINTGFKPCVEVKETVVKNYNKTTNEELNSKYDPDWIKGIGGK